MRERLEKLLMEEKILEADGEKLIEMFFGVGHDEREILIQIFEGHPGSLIIFNNSFKEKIQAATINPEQFSNILVKEKSMLDEIIKDL